MPFLVRFSSAPAASVAVYLVVAPSRSASFRIVFISIVDALVTALTLAIAFSKSAPTLTTDLPNAVTEPRAKADFIYLPNVSICRRMFFKPLVNWPAISRSDMFIDVLFPAINM